MPDAAFTNEIYKNENFEYMRNSTGTNELIRIQKISTGLRFVIRGFNAKEKTSIITIVYYVGIAFLLLEMLPYLMDFLILLIHPKADEIRDHKYTYLNKEYRPIKPKNL